MSDNIFTLRNWNYSFYNSDSYKALISIVANPSESNEVEYLYCPTVLDGENREVFQKDFDSLANAIEFMNKSYSHWKFIDPSSSDKGCTTCSAH